MVDDDEELRAGRAALRRGLLWYVGFLAMALLLLASLVVSGVEGALYVWLVIVLVVVGLLAQQVWQHARDLGSPPVVTEGVVGRKWQRAELMIAWQTFYVQVDKRIFKFGARDFLLVEEGKRVRVRHFPRTLEIVAVEIVWSG